MFGGEVDIVGVQVFLVDSVLVVPALFQGCQFFFNAAQRATKGSNACHLKFSGMLRHAFGGAVIFLSLQHFISPSLN